MVAGHVIEDDGKTWKLTLRDGLQFHRGEKVLACDCAASIKRWGARDAIGQALMARTDELSAADDKTIVFRLTQEKIGAEIQLQAFDDVPFYPLGLIQPTTTFRKDITAVPEGFVIFRNVRRA